MTNPPSFPLDGIVAIIRDHPELADRFNGRRVDGVFSGEAVRTHFITNRRGEDDSYDEGIDCGSIDSWAIFTANAMPNGTAFTSATELVNGVYWSAIEDECRIEARDGDIEAMRAHGVSPEEWGADDDESEAILAAEAAAAEVAA